MILDASSSLEFEYIVTYKLHKYLPLILQWLLSEPQVSYDDFVAAGSLGAAREKGLVNKFALLHLYILWFEKRAVKYMFIPCLICHWLQLRLEGKDYVVQEGDVMLFRFNVWQ